MRSKELFYWIQERLKILKLKERGAVKPWTDNAILQSYRFCNVHREDDTVTKWIARNWRGPHAEDPDLWFAMSVARFLNLPESLEDLGYPVPWKEGKFLAKMQKRRNDGNLVFNSAYIVSTNGRAMEKLQYLVQYVFNPLWEQRKNVQSLIQRGTLFEVHDGLMGFQGMGSFMAAQVVADLKYVKPLLKAPDWWTFAASGPGSRRGLNRVFDLPKDQRMPEHVWHTNLMLLKEEIDKMGRIAGLWSDQIHAQDLQNCLCEFDKYERVRLGEGRPKSLYPGRV